VRRDFLHLSLIVTTSQDGYAMFSLSAFTRLSFVLLAVSGALVMASCGTDDAFGKRYPVSGSVTYNGTPLEKGTISFVPEEGKGVGATGVIENGSYTLSTGGNNDGARAGKYKVTIASKEDTSAKAKAAFEKAQAAASRQAGSAESPGYIPKQFVAKAAAEAKSLIPAGYGDITTTTLTAEVKEQSNSLDFKLSDAEAPPEPHKTSTKRGGRGRP
jgi:hypothetical protein